MIFESEGNASWIYSLILNAVGPMARGAYLNVVVFDKDFNYIEGQSGKVAIRDVSKYVPGSGNYGTYEQVNLPQEIVIQQAGYVLVYLSNETPGSEVYFDDFTIQHTTTPILQKDDYYPFGLSIAGLSAQRDRVLMNRYLYNGKELQDELDLGWFDYGKRMYQPDIGRWSVLDSKADLLEMSSPYVYSLNSPITYVDHDGDLPILINGRVGSESERASPLYWTKEVLSTIANSGIPNPHTSSDDEFEFVDGDQYYSHKTDFSTGKAYGNIKGSWLRGNDPSSRIEAGYESLTPEEFQKILSKLERKDGKIVEKIQIYTHSRGAAFGAGFTARLLEYINDHGDEFADAEHEIDFVYNMAPNESWGVKGPNGVDNYSQHHDKDWLSGNDMGGLKGAFSSDEGKGGIVPTAHSVTSFKNDLKAFTSAVLSGGSSKKVINKFISIMENKYHIKVTVH